MAMTSREAFALQELCKAANVDWEKLQHWLPYAAGAGLGLGAYALAPRDNMLWGLGAAGAGALGAHMLSQHQLGKSPLDMIEDAGNQAGELGSQIWGGVKDWWNKPPAPPEPELPKQGSTRLGLLIELLLKHAGEAPVFNSVQTARLPTPAGQSSMGGQQGVGAPAAGSTPSGTTSSLQGPRNSIPMPYGSVATTGPT